MANELDFGTGIALIKGLGGKPTDAQVTSAVDAWLDDHPEATTTVEDGSISEAKLDNNLKGVVADVGDLKTHFADEEEMIRQKVSIEIMPLEMGNISMSSSGWSYSSSSTRVRIKNGTSIHLDAGDIIGMTTYTGNRMYIGWLPDGETTYGLKGWLTDDFIAPVSGEYTILLSKSPEASVTVAYFDELLFIRRVGSINYEIRNIPMLSRNGVNLINLEKINNGYFETNGNVYTGSYGEKYCEEYIKVNAGDKYRFICTCAVDGAGWMRVICYDGAQSVISNISETKAQYLFDYYEYGLGFCSFEFTIPENVYKIRVSWRAYGNAWGYLTKQPAYISDDVDKIRKASATLGTVVGLSHMKGISHTGYYNYPENTIPAYVKARKQGFKYVETDVQFTEDDVPVLLHDETINRTARNADGTELSDTVYINSITYSESQEYDFGIYMGSQFAGTKLPRLADFVCLCKRLGLHPYIEIKLGATEAQVNSCVSLVKQYGMIRNVTWISFSDTVLGYIKLADAKARLGYVVSTINATAITTAQALITSTNDVFINANYAYLTSETVALCIAANLPLEVWTLNEMPALQSLDQYVSGVTSDRFNADGVLYGWGLSTS